MTLRPKLIASKYKICVVMLFEQNGGITEQLTRFVSLHRILLGV
jgi:hypothetical protein